jgi:hypothetical protein
VRTVSEFLHRAQVTDELRTLLVPQITRSGKEGPRVSTLNAIRLFQTLLVI